MYPCFHSVGLHDVAVIKMLEYVSGAGYPAVELNAETLPFAQPHVTPQTSAGERAGLVSACNRLGLKIAAIGAKTAMLQESTVQRHDALNFVKGCIDLAGDLNVDYVHILSGKRHPAVGYKDAWRWFADGVQMLCEYARARNVSLGIEAIAGHLFHSVDDYHRLYADLPGAPFKVMYDPSHIIVQGESPARVPDELGDKIAHVHLKDGRGLYPEFSFPPLGEGNIDFEDLVTRLRNVGYDRALSVEYEAQVFGYSRTRDYILNGQKQFCDALISGERKT